MHDVLARVCSHTSQSKVEYSCGFPRETHCKVRTLQLCRVYARTRTRGDAVNRRPRIPGTSGRNTLYVLPEIRDDWPAELKDALAIRNACAVEGQCPDCGVVGEITPDESRSLLFHYTFRHEEWCRVLRDEAVA